MSPFRDVVTYQFWQSKYSRPGHGSNEIKLSCGHSMWQKAHVTMPQRKRCRLCPDINRKTNEPT